MFFSEEKNQKTFISCAGPGLSGQFHDLRAAPMTQKFFDCFFQKRTFFFGVSDAER
jgi:hypothetical protein